MKRLILLILITFFSVPNLIYAQDLDLKQIANNKEKNKKDRVERIKIQRPTGFIVSLGYGVFSKEYDIYDPYDGFEIIERGEYYSKEINIRLHYILKNRNLGFYISPIVKNTFNERVENMMTATSPGQSHNSNHSMLGSIQFGVSTNIINRITISAGSAFSINEIAPINNFEIGVMIYLTEKVNFEYRYADFKIKSNYDFYRQEVDRESDALHLFSVGYVISTSN